MSLNIEKIKEDNKIEIELEDGALTEYTYTMLRASVAETIIKYRKKMGYTQVDLAGMLNISQARIAKIEDGINITLKTLCDINNVLETKEYSFILDVLDNMKTNIKNMRKLNYSCEIESAVIYNVFDYSSNVDYSYTKENNVVYPQIWDNVS